MKKIISALLVCLFLVSLAVVPSFAKQSNVTVEAPKFTTAPTIDGVLSEDEWGAISVTVKASEAQNKDNKSEGVNEYNTYFGLVGDAIVDPDFVENAYYDLWLRYDDDYFYVAVRVNDCDGGHSAPYQGDSVWNDDAVQLRIDPQGPNSKMKEDDPSYDYTTTEFDYVKGTKSGGGFGDNCGIHVTFNLLYHLGKAPEKL